MACKIAFTQFYSFKIVFNLNSNKYNEKNVNLYKKYKKCIFYKTNSRDKKSVECMKKIHSTKRSTG